VFALFAFAASQAAQPVSGVMIDGNKLYEECTTPKSRSTHYQDSASCISFVLGVSDMNGLMAPLRDVEPLFCVPQTATSGQLKDITVKYLENHPERRHGLAAGEVMMALRQSFPCK
jgi:hypothetical protein